MDDEIIGAAWILLSLKATHVGEDDYVTAQQEAEEHLQFAKYHRATSEPA